MGALATETENQILYANFLHLGFCLSVVQGMYLDYKHSLVTFWYQDQAGVTAEWSIGWAAGMTEHSSEDALQRWQRDFPEQRHKLHGTQRMKRFKDRRMCLSQTGIWTPKLMSLLQHHQNSNSYCIWKGKGSLEENFPSSPGRASLSSRV